jgi:hypothetical protein
VDSFPVAGDTLHVEELIQGHEGKCDINFLWIKPTVDDPVYSFWVLRDKDVFWETAHILFTDVDNSSAWRDLEAYPCIRWGSIFLLVYDRMTKPRPCPSQRGMYIK